MHRADRDDDPREENARIPTRRVLDELPARVVAFLRATGTHAGIRAPGERAPLGDLVYTAQSVPMPMATTPATHVTTDADANIRDPRQKELIALYRWFTDWSATAHALIARRDWIIVLGLVDRRRAAASSM